MRAFIHKGRTYLRVIPSKFMMRSTMIYDMVTRGDVLAMDIVEQKLVVIKGTEQVEHLEMEVSYTGPVQKDMFPNDSPTKSS